MSSETSAIVAQSVTKSYRIGVGRARAREMLPWPVDQLVRNAFPRWWVRNTFNALEDVSVSIPRGSTVGIVGHNGAGKTTLLKVLAGVTSPTIGAVTVSGRIAALIDVLIGFHPDLTGRENAYMLGAIHGHSRRSMGQRMDRILEFAEIDDLVDTPLKRFSAGMTSRLGFATITALDPDVLLVDEILSVGDANFQRKCARWMDDYRNQGGTLLFVSHNLGLVRNMTERVVWIDHGKVVDDGPTSDVLAQYARAMERRDEGPPANSRRKAQRIMEARGLHRWGAGGARLEEVHFDESPAKAGLKVQITYQAVALDEGIFCVGFIDEGGREVGAAASPLLSLNGNGGARSVRCDIQPLPLRSGIYFPVVAILSPDGVVRDRWRLERAVVVDRAGEIAMADTFGPVNISASWLPG
jgi:ABC-type polysaccharide/polyol phosphate transport system ATPase subunit